MLQLAQSSQLARWIRVTFERVICCLPVKKPSYFKHLLLFSTVNKQELPSSHLLCLCTPEHLPVSCKLSAGWCSLEDPPEGNLPGLGAEV